MLTTPETASGRSHIVPPQPAPLDLQAGLLAQVIRLAALEGQVAGLAARVVELELPWWAQAWRWGQRGWWWSRAQGMGWLARWRAFRKSRD